MEQESALQQNLLANDIFDGDDTLDSVQVDDRFNMMKESRPDGMHSIKLNLRSIPDELVASVASIVQEDVDGEAEDRTENNLEKERKRQIIV